MEGVHPASLKLLKEHGYTDIETVSASLSESELKKKISQVHLLGIRSKTQLTKDVINSANRLLGIGAFCIGTNQLLMNN